MFEGKKLFFTSLTQTCNEYLIKFSENQSAPKLENRETSPCSPCAPNLLHMLVSRIPGYHNLCSPVDYHKTFITAFTASWHDGQEYGTKRDNTTSKRGSWIILFGPPPHKMLAPVSVYTLFISYIFFFNSREQEFSCLQTNDKIFVKEKSLFALEWVFFAK